MRLARGEDKLGCKGKDYNLDKRIANRGTRKPAKQHFRKLNFCDGSVKSKSAAANFK